MYLRRASLVIVAIALSIILLPRAGHAVCAGRFINPVTDICWHCIFPIKVGGVTVVPGMPDIPDLTNLPVCTCPMPPPLPPRIGIPISLWEPARMIETVKDPYCFPSIGTGLSNPADGFQGGVTDAAKPETFAQAHYFIFPVWAIMQIAIDSVCVEKGGFDVAYITEIDPLWNDDLLSQILTPEALLFANPISVMACTADAAAATIGYPLSYMPWCMGSWDTVFPMTGNVYDGNYTEANAAIAGRMLYKMARQLLVCDTNVNLCTCFPTPVWIKHHYRLQVAMPVRDATCHPIGRPGIIWAWGKNPPYGIAGRAGDNFLWILFRKRSCCAF